MSEGIAKGAIVRYAAKQVPKGTPFDVGEQVKVKTVSSNGSKAWVYSVDDPGTSAWVPTRDLEPIEEGRRPPDPERVRIWDALKAANADRAATKHAACDAERPQDRAEPPKAQKAEPMPEGAPAKPQAAFGAFEVGSKMPDGLAWPAIGGEPIPIGTVVRITVGGVRNGKPYPRHGHVIGACVRDGEKCAVVTIGKAFRAFPIAEIMKATDFKASMSKTTRARLEAFADKLSAERREELMAIMEGRMV